VANYCDRVGSGNGGWGGGARVSSSSSIESQGEEKSQKRTEVLCSSASQALGGLKDEGLATGKNSNRKAAESNRERAASTAADGH